MLSDEYRTFISGGGIVLTNTDITIYSREYDPSSRLDKWKRTYVSEAWWFKEEKSSVTTDGLKSADVYTVRVPGTKVEVKKDDYIVKGNCKIDMQTVNDLIGCENTRVTSVNYNTFGDNPHVKVVGV